MSRSSWSWLPRPRPVQRDGNDVGLCAVHVLAAMAALAYASHARPSHCTIVAVMIEGVGLGEMATTVVFEGPGVVE